MEFLGDPEAAKVRAYVESLEAALAGLLAFDLENDGATCDWPELQVAIKAARGLGLGPNVVGRAGRLGIDMDGLQSNLSILGTSGVLGEACSKTMLDASSTISRLRILLAHTVTEADGWHDDCRGGPIQDDPLMEEARFVGLGPNDQVEAPLTAQQEHENGTN